MARRATIRRTSKRSTISAPASRAPATRGALIQADSLRVGPSNDRFEKEADAMADHVVNGGAPAVANKTAPDPGLRRKEKGFRGLTANIQRLGGKFGNEKHDEEELQSPGRQLAQGKFMDARSGPPRISRITQQEESDRIQNKPMFMIQRECEICGGGKNKEKEKNIQPKSMVQRRGGQGGFTASPQVQSNVNAMKSGGSPLPETARTKLEPHFGNVDHVRVHTDSRAAQTAEAIQAKAFTTGNHVAFNHGQFRPGSSDGMRLLAHEVTHTFQQGGGNGRAMAKRDVVQRAPEKARSLGAIKANARRSVRSWQDTVDDAAASTAEWKRENMVKFLGLTAPVGMKMAFTQSALQSLFATTAGNSASEPMQNLTGKLAKHVAAKNARAAGKMIAATAMIRVLQTLSLSGGPATFIGGLILGSILEWGVAWLFDFVSGKKGVEDLVLDSAKVTADAISKHANRPAARAQAAATIASRRIRERLLLEINSPRSIRRIMAIERWANNDKNAVKQKAAFTSPGDFGLAAQLLALWTAQRASTPDKSVKPGNLFSTSAQQKAWERIIKELKTKTSPREQDSLSRAFSKKGAALNSFPELFAHQTVGHWSHIGLNSFLGNSYLKSVEDASVDLNITTPGGLAKENPKKMAVLLAAKYHGRETEIPTSGVKNSFRLTSMLVPPRLPFMFFHRVTKPRIAGNIRSGAAKVFVRPQLRISSNSVYVDHWRYRMVEKIKRDPGTGETRTEVYQMKISPTGNSKSFRNTFEGS